jgi:hypothetical protein
VGKQWRNEDIIFPEDAQRWEDGVEQSLKENDQNAEDLKKHNEDKNNPHGVTAAQVGLGNVLNVEQYSKAQADSLINGIKDSIYLGQYTKTAAELIHTYPTGTSTTFVRSNEGWPSYGTVVTMKGVSAGGGSLQIYTPYNTETGAYGGKAIKYRTSLYDANSPGALPWSEWKDLATTDGNVATATKLQTARTIAGIDFDGSKDIDILAGNVGAYTKAEVDTKVATAKTEVIGGNVASATKLQTARAISLTGGVTGSTSFDGSGNALISATVAGNAPSATRLATPRKIAGVDFDGTRDIAIPAENVGAYTKSETDDKFDDISVANRNHLIDSHIERTASREFLNHPSWDLAPLIDDYGLDREYTISFDLKSAVSGPIRVYSQNGSTFRYNIGTHLFNATTEYQRFSLTFKPEKSAAFETEPRSLLAFFGTYDTGRIPTVRNVSFGLGNVGGDWVPNPDELALKNDLKMSARNLLPRSSFYNGLNGWAVSGFTEITSNGEYTKISKVANSTRSTIAVNLEGIKQSRQYTIGLMVYVESVSDGATGHGTGVFLRTNDGTMQDSPVGYVDFTKVGEWQLVTATGTTRPGTWVHPVQPTLAIQANIACTIRIKEFVLVEGNHYMGWFPASSDKTDQVDFEVTQQRVETLEQNTIRLTNQFPDPDFQKREPRPFNEGNFAMTYDSNGVVLNNTTATKGRVYWATPPLNLAIGRSYNVAMFVNTDQASVRKPIEVGTVTGENIKFELQNISPVWIQGTIKLTTFAAFSIWLEPSTVLRIRELHIYEANTDITTSRIERLEKENSLSPIEPRFELGFMNYSSASGVWYCHAERRGDIVALSGAIANSVSISTTGFDKILMARLPVGYRPKKTVNRVMAGSGTAIFNMEIDPTGEIYMARYRGATTSFTYAPIEFVGAWLNVGTTYLGEDM